WVARTVPIVAPPATVRPLLVTIVPSSRTVACRAPHAIVTARPRPGSRPAKRTSPPHGARTVAPARAAMSIPRCCPASKRLARSSSNGVTTSPRTGHRHAAEALGGAARTRSAKRRTKRDIPTSIPR
ncbi:MAG: hypothetical protein AVDCRST_MAG85-3789, partial [uncultured Solirubrobacteraceae bacterium]